MEKKKKIRTTDDRGLFDVTSILLISLKSLPFALQGGKKGGVLKLNLAFGCMETEAPTDRVDDKESIKSVNLEELRRI